MIAASNQILFVPDDASDRNFCDAIETLVDTRAEYDYDPTIDCDVPFWEIIERPVVVDVTNQDGYPDSIVGYVKAGGLEGATGRNAWMGKPLSVPFVAKLESVATKGNRVLATYAVAALS